MRYRTKIYTQIAALIVAGMILAGMTPCIAAAQATASLEEQLQAQYSLVKMGGDSNGPAVIEPGTVLIIQKGGILGVPYGNMNLLAAKYQDGTLHPPATATSNTATGMGSKVCGLFGRCNGAKEQIGKQTTTRLFQVGEKVYPSKIEVHPDKDTVALSVIACDSCNNVNPATHYKSQVVFQFAKGYLAKASPPQIEDVIAQVFTIDDSGNQQGSGGGGGGAQGNDPQGGQSQAANEPPKQPQTIQLGQTTDEVSAALGQPEKIVNLGPKQIYVYKDLKVTFVRGKVVNVQ
ncbi:MAG: hypothetical protein DMG88_16235 [Acidobacteria bacterium]|nr:MAG: hypothetical protein DMG88_16235 [Acidobacteriota bacterium]